MRGLEMHRLKTRRLSNRSRTSSIDDSFLPVLKIHQLAESLKSLLPDDSVSAPDTPTALAEVSGGGRQLLISAAQSWQSDGEAAARAVGAAAGTAMMVEAAAAAETDEEKYEETDSDKDKDKDTDKETDTGEETD